MHHLLCLKCVYTHLLGFEIWEVTETVSSTKGYENVCTQCILINSSSAFACHQVYTYRSATLIYITWKTKQMNFLLLPCRKTHGKSIQPVSLYEWEQLLVAIVPGKHTVSSICRCTSFLVTFSLTISFKHPVTHGAQEWKCCIPRTALFMCS